MRIHPVIERANARTHDHRIDGAGLGNQPLDGGAIGDVASRRDGRMSLAAKFLGYGRGVGDVS